MKLSYFCKVLLIIFIMLPFTIIMGQVLYSLTFNKSDFEIGTKTGEDGVVYTQINCNRGM